MTFKTKVQKIVLEMGEDAGVQEIATRIKDIALRTIVQEMPERVDKLFQERLKEFDSIVQERVREIVTEVLEEMKHGNTKNQNA